MADPADKSHAVEQAELLRNQVAEGGLRFEAYLPHHGPRPVLPHKEVMAEMRETLKQPRPEPARWEKRSRL